MDIDSLDIQIGADALNASKSLDLLISKLGKLSTSLSNVDTQGLGNFSKALGDLTASALGFKNSGLTKRDFTKIATGINQVTSIDAGKLSAIANGLYDLSIGISSIGAASQSADSLSNLALSISKFGGKLATQATANLPQIQKDLTAFVNGMNSIGNVTFNTDSLANLALSINKFGGKMATQVITNLPQISTELQRFISELNQLQSINFDIASLLNLANAISKLGNKAATNAATNIPQLTNAIYGMMDVLSRAPNVSSNIIQMTQALANLASQGTKVGTSSNSLIRGLDRLYTSSHRAKKGALSLAAAFGKFYASYFLIVRGVKKLWTSIESSMDVIETLNYFNNAFGQVASAAVNNWEQAGYDSAEAYYNSFSERAQELTAKMAGYTITETGTLAATGAISLGIDPNALLNYQSVFAQISSSMGVTSETALLLSQALTEVGADLASVKNLSFEKVWGDMASGLVGMSRTLDKYGVNIRNVNLQQKLTELGIEANVQALNQNDKALLRAIILLDSTKYAWADLSETLDQPANQLRMLQNNFNNLSRTIGNIFLPMVSNILPYINALVIALQRLAQWIADLVGFGEINWGGTGGGANDYLSDIYDQADELASGLDEAAKNAKKLKQQLQGFDELNVLTSATDTGVSDVSSALPSGLLDDAFLNSFSEYQKVWDKAFSDLDNKAQKLADKLEKYFEPIKKIISDISIGDWFAVGQDVTSLVTGITDFFSEAIDKVDWEKIGQNIGDFLAGVDWIEILKSIGKLIWEALKAGVELWSGAFDAAPVETAIITAIGLLKFTGLGSALSGALNGAKITGSTFTVLGASISNVIGGSILAAIAGFHIGQKIYELVTGEEIVMSAGEQLKTIWTSIFDGSGKDALKLWGEDIEKSVKETGDNIAEYASNTKHKLTNTITSTNTSIALDITKTNVGILNAIKNKDLPGIIKAVQGGADELVVIGENATAGIVKSFEVSTFKSGVSSKAIISNMDRLADTFNADMPKISNVTNRTATLTSDDLRDIALGASNLKQSIKNTIGSKDINSSFSKLVSATENNSNKAVQAINKIGQSAKNLNGELKKSLSVKNVESSMSGLVTAASNIGKKFGENLSSGINSLLDKMSNITLNTKLNANPIKLFDSIKKIAISGFAEGGYPSKASLFYAGENGIPELMGTIGGKTAVASGDEITGISDTIRQTSSEEVQLLRQQNELLMRILQKDTGYSDNELFNRVKRANDRYKGNTGISAFT